LINYKTYRFSDYGVMNLWVSYVA